jgi:long-chain fatty acid transport protein
MRIGFTARGSMRIRIALPLTVLLLMWSESAQASAFSILELGARASGMGGAFVAIANDGSALFYNPAGIAFQKGTRMEMDAFLVKGKFRFTPSDTPPGTVVPEGGYDGVVSPKLQFLGNMFMTKQVSEKWTLGFGMYSPFGLGDNWTNFKDSDPANTKFVARFAGTRGRMENIWLQPTVAYRINENSAFAVGVAVVHTHMMLEQSILNPYGEDGNLFGTQLASKLFPKEDPVLAARSIARLLPEGRSRFAGTNNTIGVTAGYLLKLPQYKTNIGMMYRSPLTIHLDGKASFAFTTDYPLRSYLGADTIPKLFPEQSIRGLLSTPPSYVVGFSNTALWNSTISVDLNVQDYRRFSSVAVAFSNTKDTAVPAELRLNFGFNATFFVRSGWEKQINEKTWIRAGYYLDRSAAPDKSVGPFFPDATKHAFTGGLSRVMGNKEFTVFYQAVPTLARVTNVAENANQFTNGRYTTFLQLLGFGMHYRFGNSSASADR